MSKGKNKPVSQPKKAEASPEKDFKEGVEDFERAENKALFESLGAISDEDWKRAQLAERDQHTMDFYPGVAHYHKTALAYFEYVGLGVNLQGLNVIEVGPADFPLLNYVTNGGALVVVEPMPSEHLARIAKDKKITIVRDKFEVFDLANEGLDELTGTLEVWLFNVMQHVQDPEQVIANAKAIADRIRFFEPVEQPKTDYHPHTFSADDYSRWFGTACNLYAGGSKPGFYEANCVYGVWVKGEHDK